MTKSILIILFLLLSFRINAQPSIIVGSANGEPGDTVTIPIDYIGTGVDVVALQVNINFDNSNLSVGINCNSVLGDTGIFCSDNGSFVQIFVFGITNNVLPNGRLGTLDFIISPVAPVPSSYPIVTSNELYSSAGGGDILPVGSVNGLIVVDQQYSVGGDVSGLGTGSVTLQNNFVNNITISNNESFEFTTTIPSFSDYSVTVLNHPINPSQFCTVTGGANGDGSGEIANADITDVQVVCNDSPITVPNTYTLLEDSVLIADDVNGSVNNANDDSVLVNDSDTDTITIVNPGVFDPIGGIGGSLTINSDGTFDYMPDENTFGNAFFSFEVTDGFSLISSSLSIDVMPINDQPSFEILGNIISFPYITPPNSVVQFPGFAHNVNLGPLEDTVQSISQFDLTVISDSNSILNAVTSNVDNLGALNLDLTFNEGIAILQLILIDDGGESNGGINTSTIHEFSVSFFDGIFQNSFEEVVLTKRLKDNLDLFVFGRSIFYKNYELSQFDTSGEKLSLFYIKNWMLEVDVLESSQ